jgi:[acyl-carrier-protein] S-malonyltransferase
MRLPLLFPGQGAQTVGMARELYRTYPAVRDLFEQASDLSGLPLVGLCFSGPRAALNATEHTQPALFTVSLAVFGLLAEAGVRATWMAGHSLGELSAVTAAGAVDLTQGLGLVCARGRLMSAAVADHVGAMAAIEGPAATEIAEWFDGPAQDVWIANYNAPGQTVVSGTVAGIERVSEQARGAGVRVTRLTVSGAFHTPLLSGAAARFAALVDRVRLRDPDCPVIGNLDGMPLRTAAQVQAELRDQMCAPVRWAASLEWLRAQGGTHFVEVGPGKTLKGLLLRTVREARCMTTETSRDVAALLRALEPA